MYTQKQVADTISAIVCYLNHDEGFNTENALRNHLKDVIELDDDLIAHIDYLIVNTSI